VYMYYMIELGCGLPLSKTLNSLGPATAD
jgi:hypothetical protein